MNKVGQKTQKKTKVNFPQTVDVTDNKSYLINTFDNVEVQGNTRDSFCHLVNKENKTVIISIVSIIRNVSSHNLDQSIDEYFNVIKYRETLGKYMNK